jgi:hypothetical protein
MERLQQELNYILKTFKKNCSEYTAHPNRTRVRVEEKLETNHQFSNTAHRHPHSGRQTLPNVLKRRETQEAKDASGRRRIVRKTRRAKLEVSKNARRRMNNQNESLAEKKNLHKQNERCRTFLLLLVLVLPLARLNVARHGWMNTQEDTANVEGVRSRWNTTNRRRKEGEKKRCES